MKIFKFGGAALNSPERVQRVANIIQQEKRDDEAMVVIVSAMGKMTNAFEAYINARLQNYEGKLELDQILDFHLEMLKGLNLSRIESEVRSMLEDLNTVALKERDVFYDEIVRLGEHLSSLIVNTYLNEVQLASQWLNADELIRTDAKSRDAKIDFEISTQLLKNKVKSNAIYVIQGFIGSSASGLKTTLGREGSDYSAAAVAYCLDASSLTIWKDVSGVLSSDPRYFEQGVLLSHLNYKDAIELSYYGASIIHPKTIQPLQNKNIKLFVKSFLKPEITGTLIDNQRNTNNVEHKILHKNLILLSLKTKDFSFIEEEHMSKIFSILTKYKTKVRAIEQSAVQLSLIVRNEAQIYEDLLNELRIYFELKYNEHITLLTLRNYKNQHAEDYTNNEVVLLQKSREVMRIAYKN